MVCNRPLESCHSPTNYLQILSFKKTSVSAVSSKLDRFSGMISLTRIHGVLQNRVALYYTTLAQNHKIVSIPPHRLGRSICGLGYTDIEDRPILLESLRYLCFHRLHCVYFPCVFEAPFFWLAEALLDGHWEEFAPSCFYHCRLPVSSNFRFPFYFY